jgi:hypothetical protein
VVELTGDAFAFGLGGVCPGALGGGRGFGELGAFRE